MQSNKKWTISSIELNYKVYKVYLLLFSIMSVLEETKVHIA